MAIQNDTLTALTTEIVTAYVSKNDVDSGSLPALIENVFVALQRAGGLQQPDEPEKPKGLVSIRASIKPDRLISMLDGKPYKMLKRHLALHGYTPQSYRETFGLPHDYPMVCSEYAEKRRTLAVNIGLGHKAKEAPKPVRIPRADTVVPSITPDIEPVVTPVQTEF